MKIIHPNGSGGVSVVHRSPDAADAYLSDHDYAVKVVPQGVQFLIVDLATFFPLDGSDNEAGEPNYDKTYRDAWEADFSSPDGFGGEA